MKERPILFSAPMVRALFESRKTQTRRIVKRRKDGELPVDFHDGMFWFADGDTFAMDCPHGQSGDRLWVRETHAIMSTDTGTASIAYRERMPEGKTLADTDGGLNVISLSPEEWRWADSHIDYERWRPSIFMPRWASRITLEITKVRVQRLQEISESDAKAEGAKAADFATGRECILDPTMGSYRLHYRQIWNEINGDGNWESNPWVWAISFEVL